MRWLCILAVVLPLSQQPPEAPKDKGATESNRAHSAGHAKATTADQQAPTQSTPVVTQTPVATESQQSTAATDKRAGTNGQQRSDEDRSTQRKLILFTGVLAVVGILQLVVMFLTCLIYKRQAREMRRQRHEMRQQRHVMWQQWKAMGQQLAQMQAGGEQTNALIEQAKKQVTELHDTAEAALISAEIAAGMAIPKLVVHEFSSGNAGAAALPAMLQLPKIKLVIKNYGQTPALLVWWSILFTCEELPDIPIYSVTCPPEISPSEM